MRPILTKLLLGCLAFLALSSPAHAYIDPGSGGMIMTTILGLIAAIGYTMRKYFYKARNLFRSKSKSSSDDDAE